MTDLSKYLSEKQELIDLRAEAKRLKRELSTVKSQLTKSKNKVEKLKSDLDEVTEERRYYKRRSQQLRSELADYKPDVRHQQKVIKIRKVLNARLKDKLDISLRALYKEIAKELDTGWQYVQQVCEQYGYNKRYFEKFPKGKTESENLREYLKSNYHKWSGSDSDLARNLTSDFKLSFNTIRHIIKETKQ